MNTILIVSITLLAMGLTVAICTAIYDKTLGTKNPKYKLAWTLCSIGALCGLIPMFNHARAKDKTEVSKTYHTDIHKLETFRGEYHNIYHAYLWTEDGYAFWVQVETDEDLVFFTSKDEVVLTDAQLARFHKSTD